MSKSKGNTVDPQGLIEQYGARIPCVCSLCLLPPEQSLEWSDAGVEGAHRFLKRLWKAVFTFKEYAQKASDPATTLNVSALDDQQRALRRKTHETIAKVSKDFGERLTFNTAIAAVMELLNDIYKLTDRSNAQTLAVERRALEAAILVLAPISPHICHELWQELGHSVALIHAAWPATDASALVKSSIDIAVQISGKLRGTVTVSPTATQTEVEIAAKSQ